MILVFGIFFIGFLLNPAHFVDSRNTIPGKIYGGEVARWKEYPFQARLVTEAHGKPYHCGGALIARRWVITAAHCIKWNSSVTVILGALNISNPNEPHRQTFRKNNKLFMHYNYTKFHNDIGLIKLGRNAKLNAYVKPIKPACGKETYAGHYGIILGWGESEHSNGHTDVLRSVDVMIMANFACTEFGRLGVEMQDYHICTCGDDSKGACGGDSGGPLILRPYYSPPKILLGVVSFSWSICSQSRPTVFARVSSFTKWIKETMAEKREEEEEEEARDATTSLVFISNKTLLLTVLFVNYTYAVIFCHFRIN